MRVDVDLVVTNPGGAELQRLPLRFTRRLRGQARVELWGGDLDELLTVNAASTGDGMWTLFLRMSAGECTGEQFLYVIDLVEALRPPHSVALAVPGQPAQRPSPLTQVAASQLPPPRLRKLVEAQAAVERALGLHFPVPEAYNVDQERDLLATAALLRGETVSGAWNRFDWTMTVAEARELAGGIFRLQDQAVLEYEREWTLRLGKRVVSVGTVLVTYQTAKLAPIDIDALNGLDADVDISLRLEPGEDNTARFRLLEGQRPVAEVEKAFAQESGRPLDQRWFWTAEWQEREREVDEEITQGQLLVHEDVDSLLAHIDGLASDTE